MNGHEVAALADLYISGMMGLGDNLYQRPIVRELSRSRGVYLETPWPQLYADLPNVRPVRGSTLLRTQAKNARRPWAWHTAPRHLQRRRWHYAGHTGTIVDALCRSARVNGRLDFTGPPVATWHGTPYVVVKPSTIRREWRADAREPDPRYLARAAAALRSDYRVISIGDIDGDAEWALDPLPPADETYHRGELPVESLLALVANASAIVGGVGWLVPAAASYGVPMFLVFGGWGNANGPQRIFDPRMPTARIHCAMPDAFCMCDNKFHECDKTIASFDEQVERFRMGLGARASTVLVA